MVPHLLGVIVVLAASACAQEEPCREGTESCQGAYRTCTNSLGVVYCCMQGFFMYRIGYSVINGQSIVNACKCTSGGSGDFTSSFSKEIDTTDLLRMSSMVEKASEDGGFLFRDDTSSEVSRNSLGTFIYRDSEGNEVILDLLGNVAYMDLNGSAIKSDWAEVNVRDSEGNTINSDYLGNVDFTDNRDNVARKDSMGNVDYMDNDNINSIGNVKDVCRSSGYFIQPHNHNLTGIQQAPAINDYWAEIAERWMQWGQQFKKKMDDWKKSLDQKVDLKLKTALKGQ